MSYTLARLIAALFFALCVAIFAVINVRKAPIHYLFGSTDVPLVLIILGSALLGGLIVGLLGAVGQMRWRRERRRMQQHIETLEHELTTHQDTDEANPLYAQDTYDIASDSEADTSPIGDVDTNDHKG